MLIKILLIVMVLAISLYMFKANLGAKQTAWRRLGILGFALAAVIAVIFPEITTRIARFVGVGRGADLLLYLLVVLVLYNMLVQAKQRNAAERRLTKVAREVAINQAIIGRNGQSSLSGNFREKLLNENQPASPRDAGMNDKS